MTEKRVFFSFDFDHDANLKGSFVSQASQHVSHTLISHLKQHSKSPQIIQSRHHRQSHQLRVLAIPPLAQKCLRPQSHNPAHPLIP